MPSDPSGREVASACTELSAGKNRAVDERLELAEQVSEPKRIGRRLFLSVIGLGAIGVALGPGLSDIESKFLSVFSKRPGTGIASLVPGASQFRIYSVTNTIPLVADDAYRLRIDGLVHAPRTLSLGDLKDMPPTLLTKDFQCVTGWRVPNVHWKGVMLRDLLDLVGVDPRAKAVEFASFDGLYTESLTISEAQRADVIIAYEMLGAPVAPEHGGPVRLYVAPMYGYKSAKWLRSITLVRAARAGFWEQNGYDIEAWIGRSNGRSDQPVD